MTSYGPCRRRGLCGPARWRLCTGLLVVLAGCHAPAAQFLAPDGDDPPPSRAAVLAHNVLKDSAVELAHHPIHVCRRVLVEPLDHFGAGCRGLFTKRLWLHLQGKPEPLPEGQPPLDAEALEKDLHRLLGTDLQPAHVELYPDGPGALGALKDLIDHASRHIDVLMFEWDNDPLGTAVASWLAARAGPHLRVRVIVDGGGNLIFGHPDDATATEVNEAVYWLARQPYVEVIRGRDPFGRFDHRKLVLVDGRVAWSGGRNFNYNAFFADHDLSFTVSGPLVHDLEAGYERRWCDQGGRAAEAPVCPDAGEGPRQEDNASAHVIRTEPLKPHLARAIYAAVDAARQCVYVENYGICDSRLVCRLAAARKRGVDVRVVMPRTAYTHVMTCSNRVTVNRLLRAGVRVYLFPTMVHVKAAVVDGCWAYLGTGNYDALSLRHNHESGLAIGAGPIVRELEERLFLPDFRPEWEVTEPLPVTWPDYGCELVANLVL